MAKLVNHETTETTYPTWTVVDDKAVGDNGNRIEDDSMDLGTVYFDGDGMVFDPETESGAHHTANHLREIADLMDKLETEVKARAVGM